MTGTEVFHSEMKEVKPQSTENFRNIKPEKEMSSKELKDGVKDEFNKTAKEAKTNDVIDASEKKGLSDADRLKIKEETNWSDGIIDHIENMAQYEIYKSADLHEVEIDGRKCLVKDIDMDYIDPKTGMTNRELMENGRSPIDSKTGEKIELHHMGQDYDSPFAELCENSEHGDGNHSILHTKSEDSWRSDTKLKNQYNNTDKPNHWVERSKEV